MSVYLPLPVLRARAINSKNLRIKIWRSKETPGSSKLFKFVLIGQQFVCMTEKERDVVCVEEEEGERKRKHEHQQFL